MSNSFFHQYFLKIILFLNLFIYFGCLQPSSLPGLFSSCGERVGFSLRWHLLFLSTSSTACGLSSCHLCAPETRLHSCGAQACGSVACGIFPDQGSNPNLLAGRFFTTEPPGKPLISIFLLKCYCMPSTILYDSRDKVFAL